MTTNTFIERVLSQIQYYNYYHHYWKENLEHKKALSYDIE